MTDRTTAKLVGALFILATAAGATSLALQGALLGEPDLTAARADTGMITTGVLLEIVMAVAMVAIAIVIQPILARFSERLALGYVTARTFEGMAIAIDVAAVLTLLTAIQGPGSQTQMIVDLIVAYRDWNGVGLTFAFTAGALLLNYSLLRLGVVPKWLSLWGLVGAGLYGLGGILSLYGQDPHSTTVLALDAPLALQEMVLALWLLLKGFTAGRARAAIEPQGTNLVRPH